MQHTNQLNQSQNAVRNKQQGKKKSGELEFMSIRYNIVEKKRQLFRQVTFNEYKLLEEIILATIGADNMKKTWLSKAEVFIKDFAPLTGIALNKVYIALKSLEQRKLIIREKTRSRGREIIGLNPEQWGQILTDHQDDLERKRGLKLVVDNSKNDVPNDTEDSPESIQNEVPEGSTSDAKKDETQPQVIENIEENSLDSSRFKLDVFKGKNRGETFGLLGGGIGNRNKTKKHCPCCAYEIQPNENYCSNKCAKTIAEKISQQETAIV